MKTANCPSCGAAITFQSAVSILTICDYCKSTLIRHDLALENIGKMAELLPDSSPIQLGTQGVYRKSQFTVVGRIQLQYGQGIWNEWYLLFANQRGGWLGETLGNYALTFLIDPTEPLPPFSALRAGQSLSLKGRSFQISNIENARCVAGEGELPIRVGAGYEAPVVDLQATGNVFATLDYSENPPLVFVGEQIRFDDLQLTGLRQSMPVGWEPDAAIKAEAFQCPGCGSSLTIRAKGHTESLACGVCGSIIDITDQNFRILSTFKAQIKHEPVIPLGVHGTLENTDYEVIGYLRRCVTVDGIDYEWSEYLLFHREQGFRWLVEYNGHWSGVTTLTEPPLVTGYGARSQASFQKRLHRLFQVAEARVSYVLGEFYWRVQVGERCQISDYIAPPFQLSQERTDKEIVWSQAEYMEPERIKNTFQVESPLPARIGIGANQPSPYEAQRSKFRRLRWLFIGLLILGQIITISLSSNAQIHQQTLLFEAATKDKALTTEPFTVQGRAANIEIRTQSNLNNNWIYLEMTLIERDTGISRTINQELSYYQGVDEGETWTEGDAQDFAVLSDIPAGTYYLSVEGELPPNSPTVTCTFTFFRDTPSWSNFFLALFGLLIIPMIFSWKARAYERARWADSDPTPSDKTAANDDDSDSDFDFDFDTNNRSDD
jgi:ribosomal protein S27AE